MIELRELGPEDADALVAMHRTPEVATWWGQPDAAFPHDDEPGLSVRAIVADGELAGFLQFAQEEDPDYRHAAIDLFVDPRKHRRGIGRGALEAAVRHLVDELGHHRITIDPATDNTAAIRCYEQAGFTPVGTMRAAWRDQATGEWRDALLMERVELPSR